MKQGLKLKTRNSKLEAKNVGTLDLIKQGLQPI